MEVAAEEDGRVLGGPGVIAPLATETQTSGIGATALMMEICPSGWLSIFIPMFGTSTGFMASSGGAFDTCSSSSSLGPGVPNSRPLQTTRAIYEPTLAPYKFHALASSTSSPRPSTSPQKPPLYPRKFHRTAYEGNDASLHY